MENNSCIKLLHICKSKINEYISGKYSLSEKKNELILTTYEFWNSKIVIDVTVFLSN